MSAVGAEANPRVASAQLPPRKSEEGSSSNAEVDSSSAFERDAPTEPQSGTILASPACSACTTVGTQCTLVVNHDDCLLCQRSGLQCSLRQTNAQARKEAEEETTPGGANTITTGAVQSNDTEITDAPIPIDSAYMVEAMANIGGPTLLHHTLGLQEDRHIHYNGATTDLDKALVNLSLFDGEGESKLPQTTLRRVHEKYTFMMYGDDTSFRTEAIKQDVEDIEALVAPYGKKLVDLYFKLVHPPLPILSKPVFLEIYKRDPKELPPCLLSAVYLLALNWWDRDDDLAKLERPNMRALERLAKSTYNDATSRPKMAVVQAGLILSQHPGGESWAMTAQLVALGQDIGLHLECGTWKIPPWEIGLRKRVAWALYMQDKWSAIVHGRPSHIHSSNWAVRWICNVDFDDVEWDESDPEEEADIQKGRLIFTRSGLLSGILAEIIETFYSEKALASVENAGPQGAHLVLSLAKPIQLKLKDWYTNLPQFIRLEALSAGYLSSRPSSVGYVHVAYYAAEITLHRRIISCLHANADYVDQYIQHVCRSAAKARLISAMDLVNRLAPNHLKSFWYFSSKSDFALIGTLGSLMWATSPGREEADWYRRRLSEYRWTLSVSSQTVGENSPTAQALLILDLSTELLKQLPEKPLTSRSGSYTNVASRARTRTNYTNRASILGGYSQASSPRAAPARRPRIENPGSDADDDDEMEVDASNRRAY